MSSKRFGEYLGRHVTLSRHDVDEILEEQSGTNRRFGEIALSLGMCAPEHIWQAWCDQLLNDVQNVNLEALGIDAQAVTMISRDAALQLGVVPIRSHENTLVLAVAPDANVDRIAAELKLISPLEFRFVIADAQQIQKALGAYYTAAPNAA